MVFEAETLTASFIPLVQLWGYPGGQWLASASWPGETVYEPAPALFFKASSQGNGELRKNLS